jgi:NADH-quinone oxidoreductase subunit M
MGFVLLGVATMTPEGVQGALFANIAHGLITGLLFLVVGAVKDRHHTTDLAALPRDLRDRLPRLGWLLAFGAIAGLGLPGLAGFWGELLAIAGAWRTDSAIGFISRPLAVLAAIGTVVAAAYLLRMLRLLWHGPVSPTPGPTPGRIAALTGGPFVGDATGHEVSVTVPLVVATVALGLLPAILLDVTGPAVRVLLGGVP